MPDYLLSYALFRLIESHWQVNSLAQEIRSVEKNVHLLLASGLVILRGYKRNIVEIFGFYCHI